MYQVCSLRNRAISVAGGAVVPTVNLFNIIVVVEVRGIQLFKVCLPLNSNSRNTQFIGAFANTTASSNRWIKPSDVMISPLYNIFSIGEEDEYEENDGVLHFEQELDPD